MSMKDFLEEGTSRLAQGRPSTKCQICTNEELASEVAEYAAGLKDGTIGFTVHHMWTHYFGPNYGIGSAQTIRHHIRHHLGQTL